MPFSTCGLPVNILRISLLVQYNMKHYLKQHQSVCLQYVSDFEFNKAYYFY